MKIDRLISIIMILLQKKRVSAAELAEKFEVNLRTIYRDIETINQAGIPIVTYRGPQGGIEIMEDYKIEKKLFTLSDISELLIGLNSIYSTISSDELLEVIAKIKGLISDDDIDNVNKMTNKIFIDNTPWIGEKVTKEKLKSIRTAIDEHKIIKFKYCNRLNETNWREIEPYRLVLKNSRWYIQGYCHLRNDFRIFALSNMYYIEVIDKVFKPRDFDYECDDVYFRTGRKPIRITLRIHESLLDIMTELCGRENIEHYEGEKYTAYFPFLEDDYFYDMILRFGDKCECIEPLNVRNEIKKRAEKIYKMYI